MSKDNLSIVTKKPKALYKLSNCLRPKVTCGPPLTLSKKSKFQHENKTKNEKVKNIFEYLLTLKYFLKDNLIKFIEDEIKSSMSCNKFFSHTLKNESMRFDTIPL